MTMTRRHAVLGATAALAVLPAAGLATAAAAKTTVATAAPVAAGHVRGLWDEVINLSIRLGDHATPIVHSKSGLPGWMYDTGEANALGHARYEKLIEILRATPSSSEDIAIIARAASHVDIENGPRTFGAARLAAATQSLRAA